MVATAVAPMAKANALVAKWKFQTGEFASGDTKRMAVAKQRIPIIYKEATELGVGLPPPPEDILEDPIFSGMDYEYEAEEVEVKSAKGTKAQKAEVSNVERKAVLQEKKAAKSGGKEKAVRVKKEKTMGPCLDGCGAMVGARFFPGHDAKLKAIIVKVERGELDLDDIPEPAQELTKFTKGEVITEESKVKGEDGKMKVVKTKIQTRICVAAPVKLPGRENFTVTDREPE